MGWFARFKKTDKPPETKRARRQPPRPDPKPPQGRPRRERYSAWNDPDLPLYGDPFDG